MAWDVSVRVIRPARLWSFGAKNYGPITGRQNFSGRGDTRIIDLPLLVPFGLATLVLMLIPGSNVALIVANSVGHGTRCGLLTVAGTASAKHVSCSRNVIGCRTGFPAAC